MKLTVSSLAGHTCQSADEHQHAELPYFCLRGRQQRCAGATHWRVSIHSPHLRSSTLPPAPPPPPPHPRPLPWNWMFPNSCLQRMNLIQQQITFLQNNSKVYAAFSSKLSPNALKYSTYTFNCSFVLPPKKCRILNLHTKFNVFTMLNWHFSWLFQF